MTGGDREREAAALRDVFARHGIGPGRGPKTAKTAARHARDALLRFRDLATDLEDSEIVVLEAASAIFLLHEEDE